MANGVVEDLFAVRQAWAGIATDMLDEKAARVAGRCCFDNIARDLRRFEPAIVFTALTRLFAEDAITGKHVTDLLFIEGSGTAASFMEHYFGLA